MEDLLRIEGLTTQIPTPDGTVYPTHDVSLHVRAHEAVALVGESGSGKTITALSIMRLLPYPGRIVSGSVFFKGRDLTVLPESDMRAVRGRELGMVFQDPMTYLNPIMRIGDQIAESVALHFGVSRLEARRQALDALHIVRIPAPERVMDAYPHELSGGMRQRALIAIAAVCGPSLLIADEPTTALDVTIQAQVMSILTGLHRESGNSLLLITHDLGLVAEYCDRVYVMYAGQIVEEGDVFSLFASPKHPYTEALLRSSLNIDKRVDAFEPIQGQPPSLIAPPSGCRFHPRCPYVMQRCISEEPPYFPLHGQQGARCWLREPE